jgi:hypothetical protein
MLSLNPLRHQQTILPISTLSQQWYCEKKVDLSMLYPDADPVSPAMKTGIEGHDQLEEKAVPISTDVIESRLSKGEALTLFEFPLQAAWNGIPILGRPDLVRLEGKSAHIVAEFKFSRQAALFPSQQTQALFYGWLLQQTEFNVEELLCVITIFNPSLLQSKRLPPGLLDSLLETIEAHRPKALQKKVTSTHRGQDYTLHFFPFHLATAKGRLRWAVQYWQGERAPTANASPNKCRCCSFNAKGLCDQALSPFENQQAL